MYATLSADHTQPLLTDDGTGDDLLTDPAVSEELRERIRLWNDRYQRIIPLSTGARQRASREIDALDNTGKALACEIAAAMEPGSKIGYFSEGHLRRLWWPGGSM